MTKPLIARSTMGGDGAFGFIETNVWAFEDLYGGELHAALDRQHPRDLLL